jgi:hypothetical protein
MLHKEKMEVEPSSHLLKAPGRDISIVQTETFFALAAKPASSDGVTKDCARSTKSRYIRGLSLSTDGNEKSFFSNCAVTEPCFQSTELET